MLEEEWQERHSEDALDLRTTPAGRVLRLPITALDISATAVRAQLAAGREPRYLLPDAVFAEPDLLAPYRR